MILVISKIFISSLLLVIFSAFPQATAQCLTSNDDLKQTPTEIDLSQIQDFHLQLFRELIPTDAKTNFIFSPYSVWNALTLAYFGASGRTEEQLRQVLRHDDKLSALKNWKALEYVYKRRPKDYIGSTFISANRAYFDTRIKLRACVQDILHSEVEKIDFTKSHEASDQINGFVSQATRGTIKELVSPEDVDRARVVLANAAYFKGVWDKTFNKSDTRPARFTGLDGTQYSVDMMQQKGRFKFGYDDQLKAKFLELPYSGQSTSMLLFLPYKNTQDNFLNMIQGLSKRKFEEVINKMILTDIEVDLPKFKLETTVKEKLLLTLAAMGITDAFDRSKAQFTTFTLDREISLDNSVQKAFIDVNEEGTEASAATGFIGTKAGGTSSFECNRPFMFVIRDSDTKNILFMGSYKSSDKLNQPYKPSGEPDRNKNFPERDRVSTHSFSPNPVYSGEFSPSTISGHSNLNPIPHNQGGVSNVFSQSSSPDYSFSYLGQSSGSGPVKSQDRITPTFGENRGSISETKQTNQGSVQNFPSSVGNIGFLPNRGSNQNSDQIFIHGGSVNSGSNQNIQSQREDFKYTPSRGIVTSPQNIPSIRENNGFPLGEGVTHYPYHQNFQVTNVNSGFIPGRDIAQRPERNGSSLGENSGFISDTSVAQSKNRNDPPSDNRNFQVQDRNYIYFEENSRFIPEGEKKTQSSIRNIHLLEENSQVNQSKGVAQSSERNIPSFGGNSGFVHEKVVTQSSIKYVDFIPGPQNQERNIQSFGANRGTNQIPNQNIPTFEGIRNVNPDIGVFQQPNQYSHSLGWNTLIPFNPRPQNLENNLPVFGQINGFGGSLQNPVQQFPSYSGLIPGRVLVERPGQNGPSFGVDSGFVTNRRVHLSQGRSNPSSGGYPHNPNQNLSFL